MRFFEVVLSGAALVSAVLAAQVEFNSWPNSVKAGEAITLTYSPKDAATTIILKKGLSTDLKSVETITCTLFISLCSTLETNNLQPLPLVDPSPGPSPPASRTAPTTPSRSSRSVPRSPTTPASSL